MNLYHLQEIISLKQLWEKNPIILKKFLIHTMHLNLSPDDTNIIFLDKELFKENKKEHGKILDLNVKLGNHLLINVEMNSKNFKLIKRRNQLYVEKLDIMNFQVTNSYDDLNDNYICQINLNANDNDYDDGEESVFLYNTTKKEIFDDRLEIKIKYLEYYKKNVLY